MSLLRALDGRSFWIVVMAGILASYAIRSLRRGRQGLD